MSSINEKTVIRSRTAPATLKISSWPLRDEPIQTGILIAFTCGLSIAGAILVGHYAVGLILFAMLGLTLRRIWMPTVYELGSKGIIHSWLGRRRRTPWTEFARYEVHSHGILLCADSEPNPFSSWRGLFIRSPDRREEVLALVEFYLQGPLQTALVSTRTLNQVSPPPPVPTSD